MSNLQQQPNTTNPAPLSRSDGAKALFDKIEALRKEIPTFPFPVVHVDGRRLSNMKSVSPAFLEHSNMALESQTELTRGGVDTAELRDLFAYAVAYAPIAAAMERMATEMRSSVDAAKAKAATEALITYSVAQRLAKRPETSHLAPLVQNMRDALGRTRKSKKKAPGTTTTPPVTTTPAPTGPVTTPPVTAPPVTPPPVTTTPAPAPK